MFKLKLLRWVTGLTLFQWVWVLLLATAILVAALISEEKGPAAPSLAAAKAAFAKGEFARAQDVLQRLDQASLAAPEKVEAACCHAAALAELERTSEATQLFVSILEGDSKCSLPQELNSQKVASCYQQAQQNFARTLLRQGTEEEKRGRLKEAKVLCAKALDIVREFPEAEECLSRVDRLHIPTTPLPRPRARGRGNLSVYTEPWVKVFIPGEGIEDSPFTKELEEGTYNIGFHPEGDSTKKCVRRVTIKAGRTVKIAGPPCP